MPTVTPKLFENSLFSNLTINLKFDILQLRVSKISTSSNIPICHSHLQIVPNLLEISTTASIFLQLLILTLRNDNARTP